MQLPYKKRSHSLTTKRAKQRTPFCADEIPSRRKTKTEPKPPQLNLTVVPPWSLRLEAHPFLRLRIMEPVFTAVVAAAFTACRAAGCSRSEMVGMLHVQFLNAWSRLPVDEALDAQSIADDYFSVAYGSCGEVV
jgi:hypothetical protein